MSKLGLVHIYCGDGKGKTSAAVGLTLRAAAAGRRILFVQFFKSGRSGEVRLLAERPEVEVLVGQVTPHFFWDMTDEEKAGTRALHDSFLAAATERLKTGTCDFLVLDEAISAWNQEMLDRQALLELVDGRPEGTEIVLTGRDPAPELWERADYISEICARRHPYEKGIGARKGIEF